MLITVNPNNMNHYYLYPTGLKRYDTERPTAQNYGQHYTHGGALREWQQSGVPVELEINEQIKLDNKACNESDFKDIKEWENIFQSGINVTAYIEEREGKAYFKEVGREAVKPSKKFIITAEMRDLEKQVSLGEISYSRMIELLNEKADKWFIENSNQQLK